MTQQSAQALCETYGIAWNEAGDATALADKLAASIAQLLQEQIVASGSGSLVVSGGSTPAPVFARLSQADVDWAKVSVTLADERWVPPGHADSNESLVRDTLLANKASAASFVSLYRPDIAPENAVTAISQDIAQMSQPFTVTILGMGTDGHTASLFPDAPESELINAMALDNNEQVVIMHPPSVPQVRISLTRAALLNSHHRILHITGESKRQVLGDALALAASGADAAAIYQPSCKPIVGLLTSKPELASVFWSR